MSIDNVFQYIQQWENALAHAISHRLILSKSSLGSDNPTVVASYEQLSAFMSDGKHIRPKFAWAGWFLFSSHQPTEHDADILGHLGAACEFLHACALIHDDVIDQSPTRRSKPTTHAVFSHKYLSTTENTPTVTSESARHYGYSMAILLGDLALCMAHQEVTGLFAYNNELNSVWHAMECEVLTGQILDVSFAIENTHDEHAATLVNTLKTSSYTFVRPLELGATLAQASSNGIELVRALGHALGNAFQLQDDLLGVFATSSQTGKQQGDDLITGKSTVLINTALAIAQQKKHTDKFLFLQKSLGNIVDNNHLAEVINLLIELGAKSQVEEQISHYFTQVYKYLTQLAQLPESNQAGVEYLRSLISSIHNRSS